MTIPADPTTDASTVFSQACPSRQALELIASKWALLVIPALAEGPVRNNELMRKIEGISQKMLTQTLKELVRNGLVLRFDRQTVPPHVEYQLSTLGQSLSETLIPLDNWAERNHQNLKAARALGIGACQVLAMVPGVSRSGATIVGGMLMGLDRAAAAEFSFFLAMPTMMAAFAHSLLKVRHHLSADRAAEIVVGFIMAFIASLVVVRPFLAVVRRRGFAPFAWYRIVLGVALFLAIAARWL